MCIINIQGGLLLSDLPSHIKDVLKTPTSIMKNGDMLSAYTFIAIMRKGQAAVLSKVNGGGVRGSLQQIIFSLFGMDNYIDKPDSSLTSSINMGKFRQACTLP